MPPEEAESIDPGDKVVDDGQLSVPERVELEAELDAATTPVPSGVPQAGLGGASTRTGPTAGWITAGGIFLFGTAAATFSLWRRRRSA
jgi:hypothetical protein